MEYLPFTLTIWARTSLLTSSGTEVREEDYRDFIL
jgi:hypothetical protein